jgi:hypothetical protein
LILKLRKRTRGAGVRMPGVRRAWPGLLAALRVPPPALTQLGPTPVPPSIAVTGTCSLRPPGDSSLTLLADCETGRSFNPSRAFGTLLRPACQRTAHFPQAHGWRLGESGSNSVSMEQAPPKFRDEDVDCDMDLRPPFNQALRRLSASASASLATRSMALALLYVSVLTRRFPTWILERKDSLPRLLRPLL